MPLPSITAFILFCLCGTLPVIAQDAAPFPTPPNKKGLQVQMVQDAVALGIHHAAINVNLTALFHLSEQPGSVKFSHGARTWWINGNYAHSLDSQVKPLSDAGVLVYLIILG